MEEFIKGLARDDSADLTDAGPRKSSVSTLEERTPTFSLTIPDHVPGEKQDEGPRDEERNLRDSTDEENEKAQAANKNITPEVTGEPPNGADGGEEIKAMQNQLKEIEVFLIW